MNNFRSLALILAALLISGCSTMHFDNGPTDNPIPKVEIWHHNVALALYELSPPVDPEAHCEDSSWQSVQTQKTIVNWLAGFAAGMIIPIPAAWAPNTVTTSC